MNTQPKPVLTVLIPAWNAASTLANTLESLISQTYKNFAVCVVNDCSSDQTQAVAASFDGKLNLQVLSLPHNLGPSGAANHGLRLITTEYVARLDADDLATPERLQRQLTFLESNLEVDVCSTSMELFYEDQSRENQILQKPADDASIKTAMVQYCAISNGASMFRKSFFDDVGLYNESLPDSEDYDLWCRGALLGKCYVNLPEALTKYRQHSSHRDMDHRQRQYQRDLTVKRRYISTLLNGEQVGHLPEFFHLLTAFRDREVAITVLEQSMQIISRLARRVPNETLFWEIVASCVRRHLA
jgi:glycosyltransferase involved in cell wall biosynthesis